MEIGLLQLFEKSHQAHSVQTSLDSVNVFINSVFHSLTQEQLQVLLFHDIRHRVSSLEFNFERQMIMSLDSTYISLSKNTGQTQQIIFGLIYPLLHLLGFQGVKRMATPGK